MGITRRRFLSGAVAATTFAGSGCAARLGSKQSYVSQAVYFHNMNPVFHWSDIALQAMRDQAVAPPLATRALAMGHLAGFLAVNAIDPRYRSPHQVGEAPQGANLDVAYGMAFATAISEHFQQTFAGDKLEFMQKIPGGNAKNLGAEWGKYIGRYVVKLRTRDGAEPSKVNYDLKRYKRRGDVMQWTPTGPFYDAGEGPAIDPTFASALLPGFGAVTPWVMQSGSQFRAPAFYDPASREFAEEYVEIKELGAAHSRTRTKEQSQIALFWEDGPWGITPPGHFILIAMQVLQHVPMSMVERARAFALISMAMADAGISTWDSKYHHDVIRPETTIRYRAAKMHNPHLKFQLDPGWKSYIPTPPFPTYTSGHSAFGASAMQMLANIIGRDDISISGPSPDLVIWPKSLSNVIRHWPSLSAAADENGMSRVYGGVHWNIDNVEALRIGREIADYVFASAMEPVV